MAKFYADEHRASKSKREIERESNSSAASATAAIRAPFPYPLYGNCRPVDLWLPTTEKGEKRAGKEENEQTALLNSSGCWLSGLSLVSCGLAQIRQRQQQS